MTVKETTYFEVGQQIKFYRVKEGIPKTSETYTLTHDVCLPGGCVLRGTLGYDPARVSFSVTDKEEEKMVTTNNLYFYNSRQEYSHMINFGVYVRAGILYEPKRILGVSHLLEHMFFRRLGTLSQKELYKKFNTLGTTFRGETYDDFIRWDIECLPNGYWNSFLILMQLFQDFEWSREEFESEKSVVIRQIERQYEIEFGEYARLYSNVGSRHELSRMGTLESVEKITLDDLYQWKNKVFSSNNVCCVLTGSFSEDDLNRTLNAAEQICLRKNKMPKCKEQLPKNFGMRSERDDIVLSAEEESSDISVVFDIDKNKFAEEEVVEVCRCMGLKNHSYLSEGLVEEKVLTDEVVCNYFSYEKYGQFQIEFSVLCEDVEKGLINFKNLIAEFKRKDYEKLLGQSDYYRHYTDGIPRELNFRIAKSEFVKEEKITEGKISDYQEIIQGVFQSANMSVCITCNSQRISKKSVCSMLERMRGDL